MLWRRSAVLLLFLAGVVIPVAHATTACADTPNHAALVVDTGDRVERRCVGFSEGSITGKEVLDRGGVNAVYKEYSYGAAVCSLLGVGNSADDCLGERSGNHWQYFRAKKGTAMFTLASQGASTSDVKDGDVEGWRWKTGIPPYSPASDVCPVTPPPAPATTAATSTTTATTRVGVTLRNPTSSTDTSVGGTTEIPATTEPSTTTSTTSRQLALPINDDNKGGSPAGLIAAGALIVGFGVAAWRISRRRRLGG